MVNESKLNPCVELVHACFRPRSQAWECPRGRMHWRVCVCVRACNSQPANHVSIVSDARFLSEAHSTITTAHVHREAQGVYNHAVCSN